MSASDEHAFRELTDPYRRELQLHCHRILGSMQDAEDMVQETLLAAWRGFEAFEGRAPMRSWLYRIATNRCLNALRARSRRPREVPAMGDSLRPTRQTEPVWVEPYPDVLLEHPGPRPEPPARYEARESIELAFIVALQGLPPRQRAALVLRDVLGFRTAEVADMLETSETSVRAPCSAPVRPSKRGGRPIASARPGPTPPANAGWSAASRTPSSAVTSTRSSPCSPTTLCSMPPQPLEYQGRPAIAAFLAHRAELRGAPLRVVATRANTQPAFGCYLPDPQAASSPLRALRPHARGRRGRRDHLVRRHRRLPPLQASTDPAEPLRAHVPTTAAPARPSSITAVASVEPGIPRVLVF